MPKEVPKELLEVLACPKCKGSLDYDKAKNRLLCIKCKLAFLVKEGIPIMLEEKAESI